MADTTQSTERFRTAGRLLLGAFLALAGVGHLTFQRDEFQAQVPGWFPMDADLVVLGSGVVEIALGASLIGGAPGGCRSAGSPRRSS